MVQPLSVTQGEGQLLIKRWIERETPSPVSPLPQKVTAEDVLSINSSVPYYTDGSAEIPVTTDENGEAVLNYTGSFR